MKKYLLALTLIGGVFASCNEAVKKEETKTATTENANNAQQFFGEKITADGAMPVDSIKSMLGDKTELTCKLKGKVNEVCQKKGCWMTLRSADGTDMTVKFKDYKFFMPKDCSGKTATIEGIAKAEEVSVDELKEIARDSKKSKEEVDAIKEPTKEITFEAKGVILE